VRIPLVDGSVTGKSDSPDPANFDAKTRLYYIGNGGISANLPDSTISIFSPDEGKIIDNIVVPGNNLESMVVDDARHRLYVNIRDKQQIGVVDLQTKKLVDTWTAPGMNKNTSMAFDPATGRLFTAGRNPGDSLRVRREYRQACHSDVLRQHQRRHELGSGSEAAVCVGAGGAECVPPGFAGSLHRNSEPA
jgi:hypothetical protein